MQHENDYIVTHDVTENKIFLRKKSGEAVNKRVQIVALKKEFPFLFAGSVNIGSDFTTWISPSTRNDFLDWKKGGCTVRIMSESRIEQETIIDIPSSKTKVLFVVPHLSTGGCPQYLLKRIETFAELLDVYVVEYNFLGSAYVVQRNKIIALLEKGRFFSLGEDKQSLLKIIESVSPDIVHFEEMPEHPEFSVPFDILKKIYMKPERQYLIAETTHSSRSLPDHKVFLPDKFVFCSKYSQEVFKSLDIPSEVWEYPIENFTRKDRKLALKEIGLDPSYVHVLNVGLFTPGKNQGELFEIAKLFVNERVKFHFVGNQAPNFEHYWGPLMKNVPHNCQIWEERADVESFLSACDIFYFASKFELNPLVIKEALSWKMPVLMHNLPTYVGTYDDIQSVSFLTNSVQENVKLLKNLIDNVEISSKRAKIVHLVSDISSEMEQKSISSVSSLASKNIEYTLHLNPVTTDMPDKEPLMPNVQLRPGHFGCFEAFRKAISEDFTDEYDFVIVCERDCLLEKPVEEIHSLLNKTFSLMEKESIEYFTFGDKVDLDNCFIQSEKIKDLPGGFAYLTDKVIGLQFVIFSKRGRDFLRTQFAESGWYGMDIWLNIIFEKASKKMGILNERVTTQMDGFSLIDQKEKTFKANVK